MNDLSGMGIIQGGGDLIGTLGHGVPGQSALLGDNLGQVRAVDEFHGQI